MPPVEGRPLIMYLTVLENSMGCVLGQHDESGRKEHAIYCLSKSFDDGVSKPVEDIDWDALTVKGTCQEIEKRYLRLTPAPDPATVRPAIGVLFLYKSAVTCEMHSNMILCS